VGLLGALTVLSIGKLGRGAEGYYLRSVAAGVEDYYLGSGEATGYWIGRGSAGLDCPGRSRRKVLYD
jgi:hypothetical protein